MRHELGQRVQLGELILRERLGRKQIQRARRRVLQDRVEDRRVVAERLARRGRRDRDDVPAGEHVLERFRLVRVELLDAARRPARRAAARRFRPETAANDRGDRRQPVRRGDDRIGIAPHRRRRGRQPPQRLLQRAVLVSGDDGEGLLSHGKLLSPWGLRERS